MVNGNEAFSPSLASVVWFPLGLVPAPEGFLLGWGGDRCVSVIPFKIVFSLWRFLSFSHLFSLSTLVLLVHRMRVLLSALLCSVWLTWDSRNVANAVRQRKNKAWSVSPAKQGTLPATSETNNTCFSTKSFCWQILHFFSYQLIGVPNPQWQEDFVDRIPGVLSELHSLQAAALLLHGSEDSLVYCIVWFWVRLFLFSCLKLVER